MISKSGYRIPRPLSSIQHASLPNEIIHFDYSYMGAGLSGNKYALVIKDDFSGYIWLYPAATTDATHAAQKLHRWIRVFSPMQMWISDQGSHFKNEILANLSSVYRITHQFTVAYSPWINGTVEICMKHIKAACAALRSELRLGPQNWPLLLDIVMGALNSAPLPRLGRDEDGNYRTPLQVMTGLKPNRIFALQKLEAVKESRQYPIYAFRKC